MGEVLVFQMCAMQCKAGQGLRKARAVFVIGLDTLWGISSPQSMHNLICSGMTE